jgi:hypothetical protein
MDGWMSLARALASGLVPQKKAEEVAKKKKEEEEAHTHTHTHTHTVPVLARDSLMIYVYSEYDL